ncbi:MAG: MATE family efflux transporter [Betaproteobacteria bacterium]|nr:MATE family efflux transporter [Betaproteobacteria bacterium]NBY33070.1 MATE family efflux transporter [Betaproteobacteria bacterium]
MSERRSVLKHAVTVLLGQLAVISFGVTDTIVAGRYDPHALAALSISSAIYISVYVALMGVLQALLPMLAELHGAKSYQKVGKLFHQGIYLMGILSLIGIAVLLSPGLILHWTKVPENLHIVIFDYLFLLAVALAPALFFRMFSSLSQSLGKPKTVAYIQVAGLAVKIPLSILLTFGFDVLEPRGLQGCAMATVIVNFGMLFVSLWLLKNSAFFQPYGIWKKLYPPNLKDIGRITRLGIPNGLSVTVEVTSFTMMALFIARLGTSAAASHQVAANLAALLYMVPLSFSIATSARASYWIGAQNVEMMKQSVRSGFELILFIAFVLAGVVWFGQTEIASIYVNDTSVLQITSELIGLVALYHFFDAIQTMCFFVLRSLKIVFIPFIIYSCMLWGLGLGGGFMLAYEYEWLFYQSPSAFWLSSSTALIFVSLSLLLLLRMKLSRFAPEP